MAKHHTTFAADGALTQIAICKKPRAADDYKATISIGGDFGGGTLTLFLSLNNGTDKLAMRNLSGTAYSTTVADLISSEFEASGDNDEPTIMYATLNGSTDPALRIVVSDNT